MVGQSTLVASLEDHAEGLGSSLSRGCGKHPEGHRQLLRQWQRAGCGSPADGESLWAGVRSEAEGQRDLSPLEGRRSSVCGGWVGGRELRDGGRGQITGGAASAGAMMRSLDFILNLPVTGWGDGARVCPALPPRPQVATCVTLGRPSPPVQVLGDVVVFTKKWQAGTQDTALSRPALNSWVCDKRQVLCLNLAAQTFHRSTRYPPRNETRAQGTCMAAQLLLN